MNKTFFATIGIFLLMAGTLPAAAAFSDVSTSNPHFTAIDYVQSAGIVSGYADGTYKPDNFVNRAEFVKILVGSTLDYDPSQDPSGYDIFALVGIDLTDIAHGEWYVPYVRKALENNIIGGYPDKTFRGANNINFAESAKILVGSFKLGTLPDSYNNDWYDKYIYALEQHHAVPTSLACAAQNVTRGQLAEMIYRLKTQNTLLPSVTSYTEVNGKLVYSVNLSNQTLCDSSGKLLPAGEPAVPSVINSTVKIVTLDDSDLENGSTMYDFDTEQRTNSDVSPDMMLGSIFYEDSWTRGVDWQVVPMIEKFEDITSCPATGYAGVYNVGPDGFGTPYTAWQGDIFCLKTSEGKYVLLEVISSYNEEYNRFLIFKYKMNRAGGTSMQ